MGTDYIVISEVQFSLLIDQAESLTDIKYVYEKFNDSPNYKIEIKDKWIWKKLISFGSGLLYAEDRNKPANAAIPNSKIWIQRFL